MQLVEAYGAALPDWRATAAAARRNPEVIGAAPFIATQALIARGETQQAGI